MTKIVMYQKSTCGTCRKEKEYLAQEGISFVEIDIVKNPPAREFLDRNIDETALEAYVNKHSKPYRELNLSKKKLTKRELIDLMLEQPDLIKRPILVDGKRVYFGFTEL